MPSCHLEGWCAGPTKTLQHDRGSSSRTHYNSTGCMGRANCTMAGKGLTVGCLHGCAEQPTRDMRSLHSTSRRASLRRFTHSSNSEPVGADAVANLDVPAKAQHANMARRTAAEHYWVQVHPSSLQGHQPTPAAAAAAVNRPWRCLRSLQATS